MYLSGLTLKCHTLVSLSGVNLRGQGSKLDELGELEELSELDDSPDINCIDTAKETLGDPCKINCIDGLNEILK